MKLQKIKLFFALLISITNLSCQKDIQKYKNSTTANEPNLKLNSTVYISSSTIPNINDFISYNQEDAIFGKTTRIHRLVAKDGDILELRDGIVFLNGKDIDAGKNFIHFYKLTKPTYLNVRQKENLSNETTLIPIGKDSISVLLPDLVAENHNLKMSRQIKKKGVADDYIKRTYKNDWNEDNFGPLKIPHGKYFVIGDNRHNSEDSRYFGLVDKTQVLGTLVKKQ